MIYTVSLNPAIDKTVYIDDFKINRVNRIKESLINAGGKGVNLSKIISNLGGTSTALLVLGKNSKDFFAKELRKSDINFNFFESGLQTRTNTKVVDSLNNTFTDINEKGDCLDGNILSEIDTYLKKHLKSKDALVLSGSIPKNTPTDIYNKWIALSNEVGAISILDAEGELLKSGIEANPYIIKPNIHELSSYCGKNLDNDTQIIEEARKILDKGVKIIIVSKGENGSLLITENKVLKAKGVCVNVKSTVGAGDAMLGGLVFKFLQDKDIISAFRLGIACSLATIQKEGTIMASKEEINKMLEKIEINK